MLYFAYGSNLNRHHFELLCPAAVAVGRASLGDHRLVFRRFADIEPAPGSIVHGALWRVTTACEAALDRYEEVASGLYRRVVVNVLSHSGGVVQALTYRMTRTDLEGPTEPYLALIAAGYADFGIDLGGLNHLADQGEGQETPGLYATRPDA